MIVNDIYVVEETLILLLDIYINTKICIYFIKLLQLFVNDYRALTNLSSICSIWCLRKKKDDRGTIKGNVSGRDLHFRSVICSRTQTMSPAGFSLRAHKRDRYSTHSHLVDLFNHPLLFYQPATHVSKFAPQN